MSKRILVTGSAGFVGSHVLKRFSEQGYEVYSLTRKEADLTNRNRVEELVKKVKPQWVFHLATRGAYHWQNDPSDIFQTNVLGSYYLFEALKQVGNVELVVNVGSSSEYGLKDKAFNESDQIAPMSYYAVAKAAQTLLAQFEAKNNGLPVVSVRLFTVYGPGENPKKLIPTLIQKVTLNQVAQLANSQSAHDYVYIEDVLDAFELITTHPELAGEVLNIGSGIQTSLQDLVKVAEKAWGKQIKARWGSYQDHRWDTLHWVSDQSKTRRLLGWKAKTSLFDGLKKTYEWFSLEPHEKSSDQ